VKVLLLQHLLLLLQVTVPRLLLLMVVVVVVFIVAVLLVMMIVVVVVVVTGRIHRQVLGIVATAHAAVGRLQVQLGVAAPVTGCDRVCRRCPRPQFGRRYLKSSETR